MLLTVGIFRNFEDWRGNFNFQTGNSQWPWCWTEI